MSAFQKPTISDPFGDEERSGKLVPLVVGLAMRLECRFGWIYPPATMEFWKLKAWFQIPEPLTCDVMLIASWVEG